MGPFLDPESTFSVLNRVLHKNIDQMNIKYSAQLSMTWVRE